MGMKRQLLQERYRARKKGKVPDAKLLFCAGLTRTSDTQNSTNATGIGSAAAVSASETQQGLRRAELRPSLARGRPKVPRSVNPSPCSTASLPEVKARSFPEETSDPSARPLSEDSPAKGPGHLPPPYLPNVAEVGWAQLGQALLQHRRWEAQWLVPVETQGRVEARWRCRGGGQAVRRRRR